MKKKWRGFFPIKMMLEIKELGTRIQVPYFESIEVILVKLWMLIVS